MGKKYLGDIIVLLFFAGIVFIVFYPALFAPPGQTLFADDMWRSYGFYRRFIIQSVQSGVFPWWNPYLFSGMPMAANPSVSIWNPVNYLPFAFVFATHIFIALSAMYWMARTVLKLDKFPSVGAAFAFGFSQYFLARTWAGHAETLATSALVPYVFGSFYRAMESKKYIIAAGISLAIQIFSGYQTVAMFTLEAVGIMAVVFSFQKRTVRPFINMIAAIIIGLLLSAVQLIPAIEFFSRSVRNYSFPYWWVATGSLIPSSLLQLFSAFALGDQYTFHGPPPNYPEQAMFVGVSTLILAVSAVFSKLLKSLKDLKLLNVFVIISVFSLWVSFGPNAPVDIHKILYDIIPMYSHIRFPPRHLILFVFSVSALAGMGIGFVKNRWAQILVVGIIFFEVFLPAKHLIEVKQLPETTYDKKLISILTSDIQPYRLLQNFGTWIPQRDALDFDAVMVHKIFSVTGYDPSMLTSYYQFIDMANGRKDSSILEHNVQIPYLDISSPYIDFLNIKYVMVPIGYDPLGGVGNDHYKLIYTNPEKQFFLYENQKVMPRFFMSRAGCNGSVNIISYDLNTITLQTNSTCADTLVSSEVMYPGWKAYIDNKKTDIFLYNNTFRSVAVPSGIHTVVMKFIPNSFMIGGGITVFTVIVLVWVKSKKYF